MNTTAKKVWVFRSKFIVVSFITALVILLTGCDEHTRAEIFNELEHEFGIQIPDFDIPTFDFEIPSFELPNFELPNFEFPSFELPSFELPSFERPEIPSPPDVSNIVDNAGNVVDNLRDATGSVIENTLDWFRSRGNNGTSQEIPPPRPAPEQTSPPPTPPPLSPSPLPYLVNNSLDEFIFCTWRRSGGGAEIAYGLLTATPTYLENSIKLVTLMEYVLDFRKIFVLIPDLTSADIIGAMEGMAVLEQGSARASQLAPVARVFGTLSKGLSIFGYALDFIFLEISLIQMYEHLRTQEIYHFNNSNYDAVVNINNMIRRIDNLQLETVNALTFYVGEVIAISMGSKKKPVFGISFFIINQMLDTPAQQAIKRIFDIYDGINANIRNRTYLD